jgi:hypothetical protein
VRHETSDDDSETDSILKLLRSKRDRRCSDDDSHNESGQLHVKEAAITAQSQAIIKPSQELYDSDSSASLSRLLTAALTAIANRKGRE